MEDGFVLAQTLRKHAEVPAALCEYESLRKSRATRVQMGSRARADICQVISPLAQLRRDFGYLFNQWFNPGAAIQRADWIYEYDVAKLAA
jgi:2-polyprenyl-6-methoxyphenol hydroxylase-like FAD-dependent oxidoreductase